MFIFLLTQLYLVSVFSLVCRNYEVSLTNFSFTFMIVIIIMYFIFNKLFLGHMIPRAIQQVLESIFVFKLKSLDSIEFSERKFYTEIFSKKKTNKFLKNKKCFYFKSNVNFVNFGYVSKIGSFLKLEKFTGKTIYYYLKPGIKNKINFKHEKVLKHFGVELKGKIYMKNKLFKGFFVISTKSVESNSNPIKMETFNLGQGNHVSNGVLLIEQKNLDNNSLDTCNNNSPIHIKSQISLKNKIENNSFIKNLDESSGELNCYDLLNKNYIEQLIWKVSIGSDGSTIYKIQDKPADVINNINDFS